MMVSILNIPGYSVLLPEFLARYPDVHPDNRQVDLIAEGFDAAIGGGFELAPGMVSRVPAPAHIIAVASPAYMKGLISLIDPAALDNFDGIFMRSQTTGRIRRLEHANLLEKTDEIVSEGLGRPAMLDGVRRRLKEFNFMP